jgi:hypothetical protein
MKKETVIKQLMEKINSGIQSLSKTESEAWASLLSDEDDYDLEAATSAAIKLGCEV